MSLGVLEVFVDEAGHLEHRDLTAPKDRTEVLVRVDHAAVLRILKTLTLDVVPQFLGDFGPWHCAAADYRGAVAIALGSEARGLSDAWGELARESVHVPMKGVADSLNVSATAAVLFYEALRQRRA
jgi:tRNA(Leu) C34 or U34 (ribose-2'-O)-methylase TrmL